MVTRVKVEGAEQLQTARRLLRGVPADVRRQTQAQVRRALPTMWAKEVDSAMVTRQDRAVLGGAKVKVGALPKLVSATKPVRSGERIWREVEFGDGRKTYVTYRGNVWRNRNVKIRRRTQRQLPSRDKSGRVLYQAARAAGPRIYSLWSQTVIRTVFDALKGGSGG